MYKQMKERNGNNCTISTSVSTRYRYYLLSDDVIIRQVDTHLVPIKCKKKKSKRKKKENKEKKNARAHTKVGFVECALRENGVNLIAHRCNATTHDTNDEKYEI